MKVVIVGDEKWSRWYAVEQVMAVLGPDDIVIHTGSSGIGTKIDVIAKRTNRSRRPRVEVQYPEVPKYPIDVARQKNALQLLAHHQPNVVVTFGETGEEPEIAAVMALAERAYPNLPIMGWDEFVAARKR